jgi:glycine cleavage system H protein
MDTIISQNKAAAKQMLLLYTKKHTWAQITPEGNIRVGVTDYASNHLKGIANIMTDSIGTQMKAMKPFGVAETWMFMFDLYAPVSGKITSINKEAKNDPSIINADPYERGWIIEIAPEKDLLQKELQKLLSLKEYQQLLQTLEGRLK